MKSLKIRTEELEGANKLLHVEIAHRKQVEAALNKALEGLKQTQAQLVQSGKLSSIGELAAGVAHELNQPLMVIRGHTQMLIRKCKTDADNYEDLEMIEKNTERLMKIINHLREFSRQSEADHTLLDVTRMIHNSFLMVEEQLRLKEIEVEMKLVQDLPKVRGAANQIEQVILNLITNARDAIEQQRRDQKGSDKPADISKKQVDRLTVETRFKNSSHNRVEILVRDTGAGIPEGIVDKIFDPFFTTKDVGEGTGLGLSISYGIIKDHKGEIEVAETGPEGTTFRVSLPIGAESV